RLLQCFQNLVAVESKASRHTFRQIATANVDLANFAAGVSTTDFLLDALSSCIANHATVVATHVVDDSLIKAVTTDPYRVGVDDTAQGDNGDFGGATTHIHHHAAVGLFHLETSTDGGRHRFFYQPYFAGTGSQGRFANRPLLNSGRQTGHAYQYPGAGLQPAGFVHFLDEVLEHFLCH